jgi:putative redox protein
MSTIEVRHQDGDRFRVRVRGHEFVVDQPVDEGGGDMGPTPTELFVSSLATCIAFYAGRFLRRHRVPLDGLGVTCDFTFADDPPARVSSIEMIVSLPEGFPEQRRAAFLAVIEHCTVHNSIRQPPKLRIELRQARGAA